MIEILVVCTGNVCRSPYAQLVLTERLRGLDVVVSSAGVRARTGATMTPEAVDLAVAAGVPEEAAAAHAAVWLTESHLRTPDVVIGMSREHRRAVVELAPSRLRSSFTARELARLGSCGRGVFVLDLERHRAFRSCADRSLRDSGRPLALRG